jgi:hypothetical protein
LEVRNQYSKTLQQLLAQPPSPSEFLDIIVRPTSLPSSCLFSFDVVDPEGTCAVVEVANFDDKLPYWSWVVAALGGTTDCLVKIRNCNVEVKEGKLHVRACWGQGGGTTSFFRLPRDYQLPAAPPTVAVVPPVTTATFNPPSTTTSTTTHQVPAWNQRRAATRVNLTSQQLPLVTLKELKSRAPSTDCVRVRACVVQHDPTEIENFSSEEDSPGVFQWGFKLVVQDLTDIADVYVAGREGDQFFELSPCDLKANEQARSRVQRCMERLAEPFSCLDCVLMPIPDTDAFCLVDTCVSLE